MNSLFGRENSLITRAVGSRDPVLRHQLNVLRRKSPKRLAFGNIDRLVFAGLYRVAPGVLDARKRPPNYRAAVAETERGAATPPIRGYSQVFRKSPRGADCVVGPRGFEPPTRPLYPDVGGAYASHRLPIIARYFLERRTIGIGLRHVRRLRLLSGVDFVE